MFPGTNIPCRISPSIAEAICPDLESKVYSFHIKEDFSSLELICATLWAVYYPVSHALFKSLKIYYNLAININDIDKALGGMLFSLKGLKVYNKPGEILQKLTDKLFRSTKENSLSRAKTQANSFLCNHRIKDLVL